MIHFSQPIWLLGGLLICLGLLFFLRVIQKKKLANLEKFASNKLIGRLTSSISPARRRYKTILIFLAIFMCFTALARPQYGYKWVEVKRKGIDLLFALDVSKSMLAQDIKPNRLRRASLAILDFVNQLEGDRVGLLPFAGSAYLMCPLTLDYEAFENSLSAVNPTIIPKGGTNLSAVINKAAETLSNEANYKILIILTDGENLQGDTLATAAKAAEQGLKIFTVGVGTSEGELIPLAAGGFAKDSQGNFVTSRLDEQVLSSIAEKTGALYVPLGKSGEGLAKIYQQKLALIPKQDLAERRHKVPIERPEWPLALAILLLGIEYCIGERRVKHKLPTMGSIRKRFGKRTNLTVLIFLAVALAQTDVYAGKGEEAYNRADYLKASEYYSKILEQHPDDPIVNYNIGTTAYKNNMLDDAIDAFSKALKSDDVELQQKAYFNLGNSHYHKGAEMAQADPQKTIAEWEQAISSIQSSLELAPKNQQAQENKAFIEKKLEELQKQQEQQKQNDQQEQKGQQQDGDSQQQNQQDTSNNNQEAQDQASDESAQPSPGDEAENPPQQNNKTENEQQNPGSENNPAPTEQNQEASADAQQAAEDAKRQQLGKMTKEEAEQLLNALKNEEGELNFVPAGSNNNTEITEDW